VLTKARVAATALAPSFCSSVTTMPIESSPTDTVTQLRLRLTRAGFTPLPLYGKAPPNKRNNKRRSLTDWEQTTNVTLAMIEMWGKTWPDAINTGVLTKQMPTLDIDINNEEAARAIEDYVRERFEEHGYILPRIGKPPKRAIPFRTDEPFAKIVTNVVAPNGSAEKIEFLADGQQVVVAGIHPETRRPYGWHGGEPGQIARNDLPYIREEEAQHLIDEIVDILVRDFGYQRAAERPRNRRKGNGDADIDIDINAATGTNSSGADDWQYLIDNICEGRELHASLRDLAATLIASGMGAGAAVNFLRGLMDTSSAPRDDRFQDRYDDISRLVESAEELCHAKDEPPPDDSNDEHTSVRPPEFSDDALALRFANRHAGGLRYVAKWSTWMCWDGTRWQFDDTLDAFNRARVICREVAAGCNKLKLRKELASAKTVAAVERLARSDRRLAATVDQWDADLWLLNTPDGMIDLRTGIMREHRAEDLITRITNVAPSKRASPLWHAFLDTVTGGDKALQQYLQRVCGYALTGSTREHALFFLWGTGANGKGTFINAVTGVLADFHRSAPIETFIASHNERHPTDLAGLRGARLVTVNETEEGRRWAEAKIKMLTGGDMVSARFMRQDFFDYVPQFKLMIAGNHKPSLRTVDEAIRRRFSLIPFTVTIPPEERDTELSEKLKAERPAILQWMIEGCLAWQKQGLAPPETVTAATEAYLEAQDTFSDWIDECCELDPNAWERSTTLFACWKAWAEQSGQYVGDAKMFRARLERYGSVEHKPERDTKRAGFRGVRLNERGWGWVDRGFLGAAERGYSGAG
jgi:putative DNA primase/helicase